MLLTVVNPFFLLANAQIMRVLSFSDMRTVKREIIDRGIEARNPNGMAKLALECGLSTETLGDVRRGHIPRTYNCSKIAKVLGVTVDELFPVTAGENVS